MRKFARQKLVFLYALLAGFVLSRSQVQAVSYATLLQLYTEAQQFYDKATDLNETIAAPEAESAEEKWNALALKKFSDLYRRLPQQKFCDSLRFFTAFKIGELQHYFEKVDEALAFYKVAIEAKKASNLPDSLLFKPYLYAGLIYYTGNKFDSALQCFKAAESIQQPYSNKLTESERLYNISGVLYYEQGNYRQAENYFRKALELLRPDHEAHDNLYVNYQINLAQIYFRLEEYDKANSIYQKLLPLGVMTNEVYHNLGILNLSLGADNKALGYLRKVSPSYNKLVRLYNNIGNAFLGLQQHDSAIAYYEKAIEVYKGFGTNRDGIGYGLTLTSLGTYMAQSKNFDSALHCYQKALHQFYPSFQSDNVHANPENFSGVFSYINLFNTLVAKAEAWHGLYRKTNQIAHAKEELATYQSAFKLIEYVERTYESDEARLFLAKIKYAVHSKPVDIAFELYKLTRESKYLEALYFLDQQNKATALALSRQIDNEANTNNSPLLKKEQTLKTAITRLSIRANQISDSTQFASLNQSIRDNEIQLSKVQEQLNQRTNFKETNIPSIASLQKKILDKTSALISFHLSENKLTTFFLTKDDAVCYQYSLPPAFYESLNAYIGRLKTSGHSAVISKQFDFYQFFFDKIPVQKFKHLILIPDDVLNYLPFEALQNEQGRYLVEQVSIQYQYSSALLEKEDNNFSNASVLSFAPFSNPDFATKFQPLPNSRDEIQMLPGTKYFDSAATKLRFLQTSASFKVLHLATHAVANNSEENKSFIAFSPRERDHLLYEQEIYNLSLRNTKLVILSACETGSGRLAKGEGVMSLSRAFRYAGCANVITSLWKANDFSTAYLMKHIHHYLEKDYSVADAVQAAKKDYLADKTIHPRLKQPYYWSHLVFIGNVQERKNSVWIWAAALLLLTIAFGLLLYGKIRKRLR